MEKPKIERLNVSKHEQQEVIDSIFEGDNVNSRLEALAVEIFTKEREIGEGNFSYVFEDPETGACCKKLKPSQKQLNTVHQEATFLSDLRGLSSEVDVPMPLISMDAYTRIESGKISKCNLLIMEQVHGPSLKDIFDGKEGVPKSFDFEKYFSLLENYISGVMHEKGIYHRDIADRNLMIDRETGKPYVIDFGDAVYYSYDGSSDGDKDPYGHTIQDTRNPPEDVDLRELSKVRSAMEKHLTINK